MLLKDDFVERTKSKVFFYIESTIWNNIDHKRLISWLNQFKEEVEEEVYLSYLLLDSLVYYNKSDCLKLLNKGIFDLVVREKVLSSDRESDFRKNEMDLKGLIKSTLSKVGFMTLLTDGDNETTVSSRVLTRYLTHEMDFPEDQIFDPSDLENVYDKYKQEEDCIIFSIEELFRCIPEHCIDAKEQLTRGNFNPTFTKINYDKSL